MSEPFKIFFMYSFQHDERFIENLLSVKKFCISCGEHYCDDCREDYGPFSENIVGVHQFDYEELPAMIEEPDAYLPEVIPPSNIIIAINLHSDLLMSIPEFAHKHGVKTVLVPVEIGELIPKGLELQVSEEFETYGIEFSFPRPFCTMKKDLKTPRINEFIDYFQIGYPEMHFVITNNTIIECTMRRTAPCGNTFYICREIVRNKARVNKKLKEVISKAHHAYPCNASMKEDSVLGDTPLHIAGYIHREAIYSAIMKVNNHSESKSKQIQNLKNELEVLKTKTLAKL
ncbi:MAG: DUF166 domain-containing protein [Promethearchaeota archaeon]